MNNIFEQYKVLIIDDEEDIVDILDTVLKREGFRKIFTANDGEGGIALCKAINPDIILLDIMLPDISGYEIYHKLKKYGDMPIIFISAKSEEMDRILGFAIGADDYITKPFSAKEVAFRLKARLKSFYQGNGFRPNELLGINSQLINEISGAKGEMIVKFGDIEVNTKTGEVHKGGKLLELTAKELKLLNYLISNPNMIISKERICHEVWGEDFFGYDNTITVHIRRLRIKIEDNPSKPQYITTVIGLGYKFVFKEKK